MTLNTFLLIVFAAVFFMMMKVFIGNLLSIFFPSKKFDFHEKLVLGWTAVTYSLYLAERFSYRVDLVPVMLLVFSLAIIYALFSIKFLIKGHDSANGCLIVSILSLPVFLIQFAPAFLNGQLFFQNYGPDLDGNLVSIGYLMDGYKYQDLINVFSEIIGSDHWSESARPDPWYLVDHRDGIAVEFFLRSVRWGHAVEAKFLNAVFHMPVWFGLMVQMLLSGVFTSWLVFNFAKEKLYICSYAVIIALIFSLTQTALLMFYEGINVQYIYTPVFLYLLLGLPRLISEDWRDMIIPCCALLLLMISFGEAAQIYGAIALGYVVISLGANTWKNICRNAVVSLCIFCIFFWVPMHDFISWTIARLSDEMAGGALHYDFFIMNLLLPLPYFGPSLRSGSEAIQLYLSGSSLANGLALLFLFALVHLLTLKSDTRKSIYAVLFVYGLTLCTAHLYALWKVIALTSSFMMINLLQKKFAVANNFKLTCLIIVLVINAVWAIRTITDYSALTKPVMASQVEVNNLPSSDCYSVLTPSDSSGYFRLGSVGQLKWLNEAHRQFGLRPQFIGEKYQNCEVYAYYDCTIENQEFCKVDNKLHFPSNTFYQTDLLVSQLTNEEGYLNKVRIEELKSEYFLDISDSGEIK
mgnify:FL=1